MHLRQRYQHESLTRKKRTRGEDVWEFAITKQGPRGKGASGRYCCSPQSTGVQNSGGMPQARPPRTGAY
jgi:hypothetical protein